MPSVTDVQQPSTTHGKSTPPPTIDSINADPITQAIILLERKQRNLGKRKEKLESYEQEAKGGKELNKDQLDALAKYPEVIGQIDCVKELSEQFKKIQIDSTKNQKRLAKQIAEEKRQLISQRLREYAQLRYLLDHRPITLNSEESILLDELSTILIPIDPSSSSIARCIDTILSIYHSSSAAATNKNLPGKNLQQVREILEQLIRTLEPPQPMISSSIIASEIPLTKNDEYPSQTVSIEEQIFDSNDLNNHPQDDDQSLDPNQHLQTLMIVNSNQQTSSSAIDEQQQQHDDQRGYEHTQRSEQYYDGHGNRSFHRSRPYNYNQQWRGSYGGRYDNSYAGGQRPYYENNRGRGGFNPNYRGNRGGNYRSGNRGYNNNGNGYPQSAHYPQVRSVPPSTEQQQ